MRLRPLITVAGLLIAFGAAAAAAVPPGAGVAGPDGLLPVPPLARVVDQAGVLTSAGRSALEGRLAGFEAESGAQVAILIVPSTGIEPIEDFANRVGSAWKIGRKDAGDGLLLVVATQDRHARIEVARALEGAIPDVLASHVIQRQMAPRFRNGDYVGGLNAALDELLPRIQQERLGGPTGRRTPGSGQAPSGLRLLLPLVAGAVIFGSALRRRLGPGGALLAGLGAGAVAAWLLTSVILGAIAAVLVFALAMALGAAARTGHVIGGPGGIYFPGGWGGGSGGGWGGSGGGGFSSGGGGDFSGGGASGDW